MQADAKKKRAQLTAAQAETPQVAVEALHVNIAAARRRAADAERTRCEAEAMSAEYTQQLELLARQLEEARQMQRRARDAAEQATLATPPPPPPPQAAEPANECVPSPSPPAPQFDPSPQGAQVTHAHTRSQNHLHHRSPSPQPQPTVAPIPNANTAAGSAVSSAVPGPTLHSPQTAATPEPPHRHVSLPAESPESWSDPVIIPPPMIRSQATSSGVTQDRQAPVIVPAPSHSTSAAPVASQLPPVIISPPQENAVSQPHVSVSEALGSASTTSHKAGSIEQSIGHVRRDTKGAQQSQSVVGDNVLSQRMDTGNQMARCSPTQVLQLSCYWFLCMCTLLCLAQLFDAYTAAKWMKSTA